MNTDYKYTSASSLAQEIETDLDNLIDLTFVFQEFTDGERMGLAQNKIVEPFLARYSMQEALQKAIGDSIMSIARDVKTLVDMLMKQDRQDSRTEKEEQR